MPRNLILCWALLTVALPAGHTHAQSKAEQRLDQLLKQLGTMSPAAWQARMKRLQAKAKGHDQRSKSLRAQATKEAQRAAATRAELDRMNKLMALLTRPGRPVAKKPATKKAVTKKPSAKKSAAKRPAAKKPAAKKPAAKKPAAKKPAAKKPQSMKRGPARKGGPRVELITYDDHVQEVFMENCSACHDEDESSGGLNLTTFATARAGGSSGTTIVPGDTNRSRLFQLVAHLQRPTMPPDESPIDKAQIELIRRWIVGGAPESKEDALAFATKKKRATQPKVVMRPRFDQPAPMPRDWDAITSTTPRRAVRAKTIATSTRSPLLAVPGLRQVIVLGSDKHDVLGILPFPHGDVEVLAFSPDASRLLVAGGTPGKRGRAVLYDVASGKAVGTYGKEFDAVIAAAVHPRLSHVALSGSGKRVRVFSTATGKLAFEVLDHNEWVLGLDFSVDGKHLVSVDRMGVIVLTETTTGRNVHVVRRHRGAVNQVRFSPDGRTFATVGDDRTIRLFRVKDGRELWQKRTGGKALAVAFSPDGKLIACGGDDAQVRMFRSNGSQLPRLPRVRDWVYSVAFSSDNKRVFAGDWSGVTTVFDIRTRRAIAQLTPSVSAAQTP